MNYARMAGPGDFDPPENNDAIDAEQRMQRLNADEVADLFRLIADNPLLCARVAELAAEYDKAEIGDEVYRAMEMECLVSIAQERLIAQRGLRTVRAEEVKVLHEAMRKSVRIVTPIADKRMEKTANKKPILPVDVRRAGWIAAMRAVIGGATCKEAGALIGVSGARCQQIVHKVMRMSLHPKRRSRPMPDHDWWDVREARKQREFWLAQADALAKEWGIEHQFQDGSHGGQHA